MPLLVLGLFGAAFGVLAAGALTGLDAGELGAAAHELGIAHPPGFPVFAQLHGLLMHTLPFGAVAFRGALASGLLGAAALACLVGAIGTLSLNRWAAVGGALAVGSSGLFVLHATTIEVYSGLALFVTAALWLGLALHRTGDRRHALVLGLLLGLAAGHHAELRLFALLLVPAAFAARRQPRVLALALAFAVLGSLCVLYLPLRSAADPARDWGNPETVAHLWDHLWGRSIRLAYADQVGQLRPEDLQTFLGQVFSSQPALLVLGLAGLLVGLKRPGVPWVAGVWLIDLLYAAAVNPMGLRDLQNGVPGVMALGLGVALALHRLGEVPRVGRLAPVAAISLVLLGISPGEALHQGRDSTFAALMDQAADEPPPEALALVASDDFAAGFAFTQGVEGQRPDLAVVVRQHVARGSSVGPVARRCPEALAGWRPGARLADLVRLRDGWPVRWEYARGLDAEAAPRLAPAYPWLANRPGLLDLAPLERLAARATAPTARQAVAAVATDFGRWHQTEAPAIAARAYHLALSLEPDGEVQRELARVEVHRGRFGEAQALLDARLAEAPEDAEALGLRGVARANRGDLAGAATDWQQALALDPAQPEARAGLARLATLPRP